MAYYKIIGCVVGKTQIKDLGISVSYGEEREISEAEFKASRDVQYALRSRFIRIERGSRPFEVQSKSSNENPKLADLENRMVGIRNSISAMDEKFSSRMTSLHEGMLKLQSLVSAVLEKEPVIVKDTIREVVKEAPEVPNIALKTRVAPEPPMYIPQIRGDSKGESSIKPKIESSKADVDSTLEDLRAMKPKI